MEHLHWEMKLIFFITGVMCTRTDKLSLFLKRLIVCVHVRKEMGCGGVCGVDGETRTGASRCLQGREREAPLPGNPALLSWAPQPLRFAGALQLLEVLGRRSGLVLNVPSFRGARRSWEEQRLQPQAKREWGEVAVGTKGLHLAFFCTISKI